MSAANATLTESICVLFHDSYEAAAPGAGWKTQEQSRKPWGELPEANKRTMRAAVQAVLASDLLNVRALDEVRVTSETGGEKGQKQARLGSIDPASLLDVAKVAGFGERKYARLNYLNGYAWSLSFDAMQRHALAFWSGEDSDPESGLPHLAHAAWHCLAMLAFARHGLGEDDRYR